MAEFGKISPSEAIKKLETREICAEMRTRSTEWLVDGVEPKVTFESDKVKDEIYSKRKHELRTADRLKRNGIEPYLVEDEKHIYNKKTKQTKTESYADLKNGYEIKTLMDASKESTVDGAIRNAKGKKNLKALVIDNYESKFTDEQCRTYILNSRRRLKTPIYQINKDGSMLRVK